MASGVMCLVNAIYWLICFILCVIFLYPLACFLYLICSILAVCIDGCSSIANIAKKWLDAPATCMKNCCNGSNISCDCL
eukprot:UN07908